jgi:hypothetical protein
VACPGSSPPILVSGQEGEIELSGNSMPSSQLSSNLLTCMHSHLAYVTSIEAGQTSTCAVIAGRCARIRRSTKAAVRFSSLAGAHYTGLAFISTLDDAAVGARRGLAFQLFLGLFGTESPYTAPREVHSPSQIRAESKSLQSIRIFPVLQFDRLRRCKRRYLQPGSFCSIGFPAAIESARASDSARQPDGYSRFFAYRASAVFRCRFADDARHLQGSAGVP